jgi:hypothetical protein
VGTLNIENTHLPWVSGWVFLCAPNAMVCQDAAFIEYPDHAACIAVCFNVRVVALNHAYTALCKRAIL